MGPGRLQLYAITASAVDFLKKKASAVDHFTFARCLYVPAFVGADHARWRAYSLRLWAPAVQLCSVWRAHDMGKQNLEEFSGLLFLLQPSFPAPGKLRQLQNIQGRFFLAMNNARYKLYPGPILPGCILLGDIHWCIRLAGGITLLINHRN
jgi:hypothetical protein